MKAGTNRLLLAYPRRPKYSYSLDRGSLVHLHRSLSCIYHCPRLWRLPPDALTVAASPRSICHVSLPPCSLCLVPLQVTSLGSHPLLSPSASSLCRSTRSSCPRQGVSLFRFSSSCVPLSSCTHRSDLSLLLIGSPDRALWRPPAPTLLPLVHGSQGGAIGFVRNYLQLHLCHFLILAFQWHFLLLLFCCQP